MSRASFRPLGVILLSVLLLSLLAGCVSSVEESGRRLRGEEDWRPAAPEAEEYKVRLGEGYPAPHPFRFEGPVGAVHLYGFPIEATTGGLSAVHVLHRLEGTAFPAPSDPAAAASDPIVRGDLEADQDVLHVGAATGRILRDGTVTAFTDETLYITASEGGITVEGTLGLDIHTAVTLDRDGAHLAFAGYPFPMMAPSGGTPDLAVTPDGEARIEAVRIRWGALDAEGRHEHDANGTVVLAAGRQVVLGAPAFRFVPATLAVGAPDTVGSALSGHRTREPLGGLYLDADAGVFRLRDESVTFDRVSVHVRDMDRFVFDPALATLDVRGTADQVIQGTRPWIQSEIAIEHPAQDDPDTVTLRVPPGKTFRTMLGTRETSDVGTTVDVQPRIGRNTHDIPVTLGNKWEDERVLDDTVARAFFDAFESIFWIPDGEVRLGPEAVAYLPVSFEVPESLDEEAEVELVLHPRNAAVLHITFVLVPDADAGTSDVSSRSPSPVWLPLAALALVGLALRRLRR